MYLIWRDVLSLSSQWGFFFHPYHLTLLWIYSSLLYPVCSTMYFASSDLAVKVTGNPPSVCGNFYFSLYITVQRFMIMLSEITITTPNATPKHMLIRAQLSPSSCLKHSSCKPTGGAAPSPPYTVRMLMLIRYASLILLHADNALPLTNACSPFGGGSVCVFMSQFDTLWLWECAWCIHGVILHSLGLFCPYRRRLLFTHAACRKAAASIMQRQHFMPHSD